MKNTKAIKASEFIEKHLDLSHVWTWTGDLHQSEDSLVPVPLLEEELQAADSLLIHAKFSTTSGIALRGLIIYQFGDNDIFAIEVLSGEHRFTLNKYAPDLSVDELNRLANFLDISVDQILPLRYEVIPAEIAIESGEFMLQI